MAAVLSIKADRYGIYSSLLSRAIEDPNSEWLCRIIASWRVGEGVLPECLGLDPERFRFLTERFFPGRRLPCKAAAGKRADFSRMPEKEALAGLLRNFANPEVAQIEEIISMLVAACLGSDHLWQDLGLWSRSDLSRMLKHNFPALVKKNVHDMKWKKFLYKQLCEAEGIHLCRAPSCDVCVDYKGCFGPEE